MHGHLSGHRTATALVAAALLFLAATARAAERPPHSSGLWAGVTFLPTSERAPGTVTTFRAAMTSAVVAGAANREEARTQTAAPAVATEYSDAYHLRARVHRIASFATLPLFATQGFLGQSLYNSSSSGKKTAHAVVGAAIGGLFGVNTVTGLWNLVEARKDPEHRKLRWAHGLLMMGADAGFLATGLLAPDNEGRFSTSTHSASTHRAVAFTSIAVATTGYLIMLVGNR
jgi:hypothetical protein